MFDSWLYTFCHDKLALRTTSIILRPQSYKIIAIEYTNKHNLTKKHSKYSTYWFHPRASSLQRTPTQNFCLIRKQHGTYQQAITHGDPSSGRLDATSQPPCRGPKWIARIMVEVAKPQINTSASPPPPSFQGHWISPVLFPQGVHECLKATAVRQYPPPQGATIGKVILSYNFWKFSQ